MSTRQANLAEASPAEPSTEPALTATPGQRVLLADFCRVWSERLSGRSPSVRAHSPIQGMSMAGSGIFWVSPPKRSRGIIRP